MRKPIKALLFGASAGGQKAILSLGRDVLVVGFLDNDPQKQGSYLGKRPIHAPAELPHLDYDCIVISSMYVSEIHAQLVQLGVPSERIVTSFSLSQPSLLYPWDVVLFLAVCLTLLGASLAWLL